LIPVMNNKNFHAIFHSAMADENVNVRLVLFRPVPEFPTITNQIPFAAYTSV
jgi:hypothetical protein